MDLQILFAQGMNATLFMYVTSKQLNTSRLYLVSVSLYLSLLVWLFTTFDNYGFGFTDIFLSYGN